MSTIFYKSFYDSIKTVSKRNQIEIYNAIFEYVFESKEPSLTGTALAVFTLIKPQIDANNQRFENGKKGGRPKNQTVTKAKPNDNLTETKSKANNNVNVNVNDNVNDNVNVNNNENVNVNDNVCVNKELKDSNTGSTVARSDTHTTPTPEMVKALFLANGRSADDAQAFIEYNDSKGWPFSLETAFKKWRDRDRSGARPGRCGGTNKFINFDQRGDRDPDYYERIVEQKLAAQEAARVKEG